MMFLMGQLLDLYGQMSVPHIRGNITINFSLLDDVLFSK